MPPGRPRILMQATRVTRLAPPDGIPGRIQPPVAPLANRSNPARGSAKSPSLKTLLGFNRRKRRCLVERSGSIAGKRRRGAGAPPPVRFSGTARLWSRAWWETGSQSQAVMSRPWPTRSPIRRPTRSPTRNWPAGHRLQSWFSGRFHPPRTRCRACRRGFMARIPNRVRFLFRFGALALALALVRVRVRVRVLRRRARLPDRIFPRGSGAQACHRRPGPPPGNPSRIRLR